MKQIFQDIISKGHWNASKTVCGNGSTITYTDNLRQQLPDLLRKHNISSMFDAPCGDYTWMSQVQLPENVKYTGGDIVDFLIEQNLDKYPGVDFCVFDITQDALPDVDLLFCRDCLIHFSHSDIRLVLDNIARSNIKYVMMTSYSQSNNEDIQTGGFRGVNFNHAPYNFETCLDSIKDWIPGYAERHMCLWPIETVTKFLNTQHHE